jgi:hypothetical protein
VYANLNSSGFTPSGNKGFTVNAYQVLPYLLI